MSDKANLPSRKADHIRINLKEDVQSDLTTGLEKYRFIHKALPEIDLEKVDLSQVIFGKTLQMPLLVSSMTGGTEEATRINQILASAAQEMGVAMGVGSQRAAIEHPDLIASYQVRSFAPDILLFANLGAVQLNYDCGVDQCQRAVDMIQADGLFLHLNPLQEALQPEGNTRFSGLLRKIETVCHKLPVPVIVKEVGWGISEETARQLESVGVTAIDVAGAGGTSWSQVEMFRMQDPHRIRIAEAFRDWGISTADSILQVRRGAPRSLVFASGGIRSGLDIAKSIALGATLGGIAGPMLLAASSGVEATLSLMREIRDEIQICMFVVGAPNIQHLRMTPMEIIPHRK